MSKGSHARLCRDMDADWARAIRDQCAAAGIPFLHEADGARAESADPAGLADTTIPDHRPACKSNTMPDPNVIPFPHRHPRCGRSFPIAIPPTNWLRGPSRRCASLQNVTAKLRARLLEMPECERRGEDYRANVASYEHNRLNIKKLRRALGPELLRPFMSRRVVQYVSLKKEPGVGQHRLVSKRVQRGTQCVNGTCHRQGLVDTRLFVVDANNNKKLRSTLSGAAFVLGLGLLEGLPSVRDTQRASGALPRIRGHSYGQLKKEKGVDVGPCAHIAETRPRWWTGTRLVVYPNGASLDSAAV